MPNNKLLLTIAGLSILINTSEDETYTRDLAAELDRDINSILNANTGASVTNAALLCAIDYLDNAKKSAKNANNMRNQVKDYMDDAAKTKFKFDEEHKRANELAVEIQSLRSHLTRLATEGDSSGVVENIKSDLAAANRELEDMRDKAGKIAAANKALSEKSAAMSDCIAGHEKEIARLGSIVSELNATISQKDEQLAALNTRIESMSGDNRSMKNENARLNTELYTLEQTMNGDRAKARELAAQLAAARLECEAARSEADAMRAELKSLKAEAFAAPELFSAPLSDEPGVLGEPNPVLFDYESPAAEPDEPDTPQTAEQITPEEASQEEASIGSEVEPIVFDGFSFSDEYAAESPAPAPAAAAGLAAEEAPPAPLAEIAEQPQPFEEPEAPADEAEVPAGAESPNGADSQLPELFEGELPDDPDMPDLSWTLEV